MTMTRSRFFALFFALALTGLAAGCAEKPTTTSNTTSAAPAGAAKTAAAPAPLRISAIPDQDPEKLQRLYKLVSNYLSKELNVPVEYKPVTDYTASVTAFKVGDLDLVWYGGLTGVQARLQVPGARAVAQRGIDADFKSHFITNAKSGITSLAGLKGRTFTFGSESSTSGRLMPQYFMNESGVTLPDLKGEPGFSGNHDKTIDLVQAGSFEAGAVNSQVWKKRVAAKTVDTSKVRVFYTTPGYHDYHWVLHPDATQRYGADFPDRVQATFLKLDAANPDHAAILDLFGDTKFIATDDKNYAKIESVGRETGLISSAP